MKDKKAAKILIKRAKANPELYTDTEVKLSLIHISEPTRPY